MSQLTYLGTWSDIRSKVATVTVLPEDVTAYNQRERQKNCPK